jgi:cysteine-S-conjugate beta-lyase
VPIRTKESKSGVLFFHCTMKYCFDSLRNRRNSDSVKWNRYGKDVLPLWVADMDFRVAEPIVHALHNRVDHEVFGYPIEPIQLREIIVHRLYHLYNWSPPRSIDLFAGRSV